MPLRAILSLLRVATTIASATANPPGGFCHAVSFAAELAAGQAFARDIGGGLELRLSPQHYVDPAAHDRRLDGWQVDIVARPSAAGAPSADRIWPVNLPLRFNPWQDIGTTYGVTAARKLGRDLAYRFAWRAADYDRIAALASDALWPYSAADPDHAGARYLDALRTLDTAELRLHPRHYALAEDGLSIRQLSLTLTITAPAAFAFADGLARRPAACPPRQQ